MALLREGIERVRAVVVPDAVAANGNGVAFSRTVLVAWKSNLGDMLHQVYVDGSLAGATANPQQRELVIQIPSFVKTAARIEVVAVDPVEVHCDFSAEIDDVTISGARVRLRLLRNQSLPFEAMADVYWDNGTGEIDYDATLSDVPIALWACRQDKAGFGLAHFGAGDFGYDAAAAIGFGKGLFGHGEFGLDADAAAWTSPILSSGTYRFGIKVIDGQGNESLADETATITVVPAARPASGLDVVTFDQQANELVLKVSD